MIKRDNFFKNYIKNSSAYYNNLKKTKKIFNSFLVDLKNFEIPLLESYEKDYEFDFSNKTFPKLPLTFVNSQIDFQKISGLSIDHFQILLKSVPKLIW